MKRKGAKTVRSCFHSLLKLNFHTRDIEVYTHVLQRNLSLGLGLLKESIHPKNRAAFLTDKSLL